MPTTRAKNTKEIWCVHAGAEPPKILGCAWYAHDKPRLMFVTYSGRDPKSFSIRESWCFGGGDAFRITKAGQTMFRDVRNAESVEPLFDDPRKTAFVTAAWLKDQKACPDGYGWFVETFGKNAKVLPKAVKAAIPDDKAGWMCWLEDRLEG